MRSIGVLLFLSCALAAETPPDAPLVRGTVLECDARPSGEISIRNADNQVLRYQFDRKTYAERDNQLIDASRLAPGEKVEILSDREKEYTLRYARTIHVIQPVPPPRPLTMGRYSAPSPEPTLPSSTTTYSGVISELTGDHVVIHTREAGDLSILLRKDTRFLEDGQIVEAAKLKPTMRVFVRAGKDVYQQVEAYQVIWGTILTPANRDR
uniref:DUF5666 domain-containing protein n=1 Tax=Solibacter usitatus (strain Ellin6076) TaxID=234267 RepID=Q025P3_SOLUE